MEVFLDICQGVGLACAVGIRPFLPGLLAGGLAAANAGLDFEGTPFAFLESPIFLLVLGLALALFTVADRRAPAGPLWLLPPGRAILVLGPVLGALLFAGSLDDRHATWWYGIPAGLACGALAAAAVASLLDRVRARLDPEAAASLPVYAEGAGLVLAGLSVLLPPLGLVGLVLLVALLVTGRRRKGQKYAGLRVLR